MNWLIRKILIYIKVNYSNYKYRLWFFKFLSSFPNKIRINIYNSIQNLLGNLNIENKVLNVKKTLVDLDSIINKEKKLNIKGVIELGSGWSPALPYVLCIDKGIPKVNSYDKNEFYNSERIGEINDYFEISNKFRLIDQVKYFPNSDLANAKLTDDSNFLISRHVLEHINPHSIKKIHQNLIHQIGDHYVLHYISPSDHRSYSDKSLFLHDFLKYSEDEWDKRSTVFDYHNRMRLPEYRKLFLKLGYKFIFEDYSVPDKQYLDQFMSLELNERFCKFSIYENSAGNLRFFMKYEK